jgi:DNA-binding CsgD family transcriptional regulator
LELTSKTETAGTDVADYIGDILIKRNQQIADIGLSQRELQIIRLSAEGLKASEIAERLFLSVHTVNTHRQRIYAKMNVKSVSDMLRKSRELGII